MESICRNVNGGYECERECPLGFQQGPDGDCIDLNECLYGMDNCLEKGMECFNTEGIN